MVVADTGPIHYLALIGCAKVLPVLFGEVLIPKAVEEELQHPKAPELVREWISASKPWLKVVDVAEERPIHGLHRGETKALHLALQMRIFGIYWMISMDEMRQSG